MTTNRAGAKKSHAVTLYIMMEVNMCSPSPFLASARVLHLPGATLPGPGLGANTHALKVCGVAIGECATDPLETSTLPTSMGPRPGRKAGISPGRICFSGDPAFWA